MLNKLNSKKKHDMKKTGKNMKQKLVSLEACDADNLQLSQYL